MENNLKYEIYHRYFSLYQTVLYAKESVFYYISLQKDNIDMFKNEILDNLINIQSDSNKKFYIEKIKENIKVVTNKDITKIESELNYLKSNVDNWLNKYNTTFDELYSLRKHTELTDILDHEPKIDRKHDFEYTQEEIEIKEDFYYYYYYLSLKTIWDFITENENNLIINPINNQIISESTTNHSDWTVKLFALFLYFLKRGDYIKSTTKKNLPELCKKYKFETKEYNYLNNSIYAIDFINVNEKNPVTKNNLRKVIELLERYPRSERLASKALSNFIDPKNKD